ncbi:MAG: 4Fe-4S cluster-binding domain-containing protein [Nanohaloarchaea archaeon]|nr:4Fe-4S cluster-binding domain-containing protein [Candidatus Nanohaloarchaea archaeon]
MTEIRDTGANSQLIGTLPDGCRMCIKGKKSVLFLTGECDKDCFYCPLSEQRKGTKKMWINEKEVKKDTDIIDEIKKCSSTGVGITGGEPLIDIDKFCHYVTLLKTEFGAHFHIHAYTTKIDLTADDIKKLNRSGLDALRFHIFNIDRLQKIKDLAEFKIGIEIPLIPGYEKTLKRLIKDAEGIIDYMNLNELEYSDTNCERMEKQGFELKEYEDYAVKGSVELGQDLLEYAAKNTKDISVHLCTASTKYDYQYWNRMKHRAENIRQPWETVTEQGLIRKGVILGNFGTMILKPDTYTEKNSRIETTVKNAKRAAKKGLDAAIVLSMPTDDSFDFELTPLDKKGRPKE